MRGYDVARWLLLATLWSMQFLFLRVAVPVFGMAAAAEGRALFAALFVLPWAVLIAREQVGLRKHWRDHLLIGVVNNVLPFVCFAVAAAVLPASYLAVMNGLVPLWAGLIAVPVLGEPFGWWRAAGFGLGIAGVALIVNLGPVALDAWTVGGALAGIAGTALWGWAGVMIKQRTGRMPPMGIAAGSITFAAVLMAPLLAFSPPVQAWTPEALGGLIGVGMLCSGLAYLPFFTLIRDIGPSRTLTVGLAVPVLGVLWGWLFLGEAVTVPMVLGTVLVVAALALVLKH